MRGGTFLQLRWSYQLLTENRALVPPPSGLAAFRTVTQGVSSLQRPPALPFRLHFVQAFSPRSNRCAVRGASLNAPNAFGRLRSKSRFR
jgi:hypothetical protein